MSKPRPFLIAIVGGSGSGKTWLGDRLEKCFAGQAMRLSLDDFYRDRSGLSPARRAKINFDNPAAIDWPAFRKVLSDLRKGRPVRCPRYDFTTHTRQKIMRVLKPGRVVLVDGLWLLRSPALRRHFDLTIFMECGQKTRLNRRLARDLKARGRTEISVRQQFCATVQPMHAKFVEPQKQWADIVLDSSFSQRQIRALARSIRRQGLALEGGFR